MLKLKQATIGTRLTVGFSAMALVALFLGILGYYGAVQNEEAMERVSGERLPAVQEVSSMEVSMHQVITSLRTLLDPEMSVQMRQQQYQNMAEIRQDYEEAIAFYESLPPISEEEQSHWNSLLQAIENWTEVNDKLFALHQELDANGIMHPEAFMDEIEGFRAELYSLETETLTMFRGQGETIIETNDSSLGQWLEAFHTENPELNSIAQGMQTPYERLRQAMSDIRQEAKDGNIERSEEIYAQEMQPAAQELSAGFDSMLAVLEDIRELRQEARSLTMNESQTYMEETSQHLSRIVEINREIAEQDSGEAIAQAKTFSTLNSIATILGVVLAGVLALTLTRSISNPMRKIAQNLSTGASQISSASSQVASSSQSQAEGTSELASNLEETSSSLEEMSSQTKQNADNASQAESGMKEAGKQVEGGMEAVQRMSQAMEEIKDSTAETSRIIKTIDDIAFQTNLLALNAAVEAARAGEAGKGFAVVAEEVRNLAQRSADAAKETSQLIEKSQSSADNGVQVSEEVTRNLEAIKEGRDKIDTLIGEIAAASQEQSRGIEQVNNAVSEMDKVVQQSASDAEETSSAAEELSSQAEEMERMVSELEALVGAAKEVKSGGASAGSGTRTGRGAPASRGDKAGQTRLDQGGQQRGTRTAAASGGAKRDQSGDTKQQKKQDQAIPLDEDEFKDF